MECLQWMSLGSGLLHGGLLLVCRPEFGTSFSASYLWKLVKTRDFMLIYIPAVSFLATSKREHDDGGNFTPFLPLKEFAAFPSNHISYDKQRLERASQTSGMECVQSEARGSSVADLAEDGSKNND